MASLSARSTDLFQRHSHARRRISAPPPYFSAMATSPTATAPTRTTPETAPRQLLRKLKSRTPTRTRVIATSICRRAIGLEATIYKAGIEIEHVSFDEDTRAPRLNYLRGKTEHLLRLAVLHSRSQWVQGPQPRRGAYLQDRRLSNPRTDRSNPVCASTGTKSFAALSSLHVSPSCILRPAPKRKPKSPAGIGLYYEHTQLEHLEPVPYAGVRYDTYFASDGIDSESPHHSKTNFPRQTTPRFTEARALNWSIGVERKLGGNTESLAVTLF